MDDPIIQNRILSLDPAYQEFVMSDFISNASYELASVGGLAEEDRVILSNGLMLYMLYFLRQDDLVQFLVDNDFDYTQAATMVNAYLEVLPPEFVEGHDEIVIELTSESDESAAPTIPVTPAISNQENSTNMYSSSQDAVLNQIPQNPNPPSETPRWGQL